MKVQRSERGQTTIFFTVFMAIVFLGMAALALDVGMLYREKRMVQAAADAAAIAASAQYSSASTAITTSAPAAALQQAGITSSAVVTPTLGSGGTAQADVVVNISQPTPTYFLGAFKSSMKSISVWAVAEAAKPPSAACLVSTGAGIAGTGDPADCSGASGGIGAGNSGKITTTNCGICSDSAIYACGSSTISGTSVSSEGTITTSGNGSISGSKSPSGAACASPITAPTPLVYSSGCNSNDSLFAGPNYASSVTLPPNPTGPAYCGFTTTHVGALILTPGLYIFDAGFNLGGGISLTCPTCTGGAGVTLYFTSGSLNGSINGSVQEGFANGTTVNLTAATSAGATNGAIPGILIWDGNTNSSSPDLIYFGGGSGTTLTGSFYAPNSNVYMDNYGVTTLTGSMVVGTLTAGGSGGITLTSPGGGAAAGQVTLVR